MASESYDPDDDWRGCISARFVPLDTITNTDMTGVMVGVAAVVLNLCLRIQIGSFNEAIDAQVISTIIQAYCILVPTLLSIGRQQLSIFDANHALTITSSPFMIHVVFSTIRDILGFETGLFKRIRSHRRVIHLSVALFLALWFGLRLILRLWDKAFQDSHLCSNPTFEDLLLELFLVFVPPTGPTGGFWVLLIGSLTFFFLSIIRGWYGVVFSFLAHREGASGSWKWLSRVWVVIRSVWDADSEDYEYDKFSFTLMVDSYWATNLVYDSYVGSGEGYKVTYGQLLALFAVLPPLLSTINLIYGFFRTLRSLAAFFLLFVMFTFAVLLITIFCAMSLLFHTLVLYIISGSTERLHVLFQILAPSYIEWALSS